jgi:CheY-like chemotaxis protein
MAKKILLIENDSSFAASIARPLEAAGFDVRVTGDGKEGLELARDWSPEAIVLCVELPGMSGYLVCQKLKKDGALKALPLVLTSSEATEETFEKHKTLKARADEYLLKPYDPDALIEKLGALIGLPEGASAELAVEDEVVNLDEGEVGLDTSSEGSPDQDLPGLDLDALPDEPAAPSGDGGADQDLQLLDDAFDGIAAPTPGDGDAALDELTSERPVQGDEVDAAAASLPEEDEGSAREDLGGLDTETESALGALGADDETLSPEIPVGRKPPARPVRGASAELLRAAGVKLLDEEPELRPRPAVAPAPPAERRGGERSRVERSDSDAETRDLERKVRELERRARDAEEEAERGRAKAESVSAQLRKAEADARAGRDEARRAADQARAAEAELSDLEQKLADAERRADAAADAVAKVESLEREADELRTDLLVARGESDGARAEIEKRTADLLKRTVEAEAAAKKNEERVVKAYQKIKADEKVREKVRKALAIATQLLEEGLPTESAAEKERRAAALGGRE